MHRIPQLSDQDDSMHIESSTLATGQGVPLHFGRAYMVLLICTRGCARFTVNFKDKALRRHDVLVLARDTVAVLRRRSRGFQATLVLMPESRAAEVAYPLPSSLFVHLHHHPYASPCASERVLLRAWLAQLQSLVETGSAFRDIMLRNLLQNFFLHMAATIPAMAEDAPEPSRGERLGLRFWELVGRHCRQRRDVAFYAAALTISPFYLSQLTRRLFDDTPKGLIDRQVVLEIKSLLAYSELQIGQIADALCFEDASYLCRYFKRHTGLALSVYRGRERGQGAPPV
ncbi:AraC family transcriptional regulator [Alcaligenes sp. SDU_A2]|uniref:AraC family transcriptional regulator n=1 Tax=Alcaligenes sp. SDU_A2 TaxID=3136634 RepID=UPI002CC8F73C|nr:helix-turn-helix domain-containing protein [Alcaligenes sp.]HRL27483.1 helix-turn-helix domain-containing protein [Alcaligenes sp.]